jgi:YesN/AraC family two-component response regulator
MAYNLLVVDDDPVFRHGLCECFDEYEITEAPDGETALKILKKPNTIDLVLLDVVMPGMRGTDVLAEMKSLKPELKIVMLTSNSSKDVAITSLKNRADEYIEKPVDVDETKEIIKKLLGEKDSEGMLGTDNINEKIEKVKIFITRNYDKKVSLEEAASHTGLNPNYLSRMFEEHTGIGFSSFRTAVKVRKAQEFLKQGYNVNQISDKLAYANAESFIRAFKKQTGSTPAMFRDRPLIKKKAAPRKIKKSKRGKK